VAYRELKNEKTISQVHSTSRCCVSAVSRKVPTPVKDSKDVKYLKGFT
jgi:hypothetical protein